MKKFIAFIMIVAMLTSMSSFVSAAEDNNPGINTVGYDEVIGLFKNLGINMEVENYQDALTRGEFIKGLTHFMKLDDMSVDSDKAIFTDVTAENPYSKYINIAYSNGFVSGSGDGKFYPDRYITYSEAVKILVEALGYGEIAIMSGGYPNGYIQKASELGIFIGKTGDQIINGADMIKMFYNATDVDMMKIIRKSPVPEYEKAGTVLEEIYDIHIIEGILSQNEYTSLTGSGGLKNEVVVDGEPLDAGVTNAADYLGYYVHCYVYDDSYVKTILHISIAEKKNELVKINVSNIIGFDNLDSLKYYADDTQSKEKELEFDNPPFVIFNGRSMIVKGENDFKLLIPENGYIEAIDYNSDNKFDVLKVTSFITYIVDSVNKTEGIIYDKYTRSVLDLQIDSDEYIIKYIIDGAETDINSIKNWNVVEVCADREKIDASGKRVIDFQNSERITLYINELSIGGVVNGVNEDENLKIDGEEYKIAKSLSNAIAAEQVFMPLAGSNGTFYINSSGEIAAFDLSAQAGIKYGFIIRGNVDENDESINLTLMLDDSSKSLFKLAKKVKIDGTSYKDMSVIAELEQLWNINESGLLYAKNQLIGYKLNEDNEIEVIDTALVTSSREDKDTALTMDLEFYGRGGNGSFSNGSYNGPGVIFSAGSFRNLGIKTKGTKVFVVSGFADTEARNRYEITDPSGARDRFTVTSNGYFGGGDYRFSGDRCLMIYNITDDNASSLMVYYNPALASSTVGNTDGSSATVVYLGRGKALNRDEVVSDYIKVHVVGSTDPVQYVCKNDLVLQNLAVTNSTQDKGGELSSGDIIRITRDINGEVTAVKRDLDFNKLQADLQRGTGEPACFAAANIENPTYMSTDIGWLATMGDSYITMAARMSEWGEGVTLQEAIKLPKNKATFTRSSNVLIYDVKEKKCIKANLDQLVFAENNSTYPSVAYIRHTTSSTSFIIAYKFD